MKYKWIKINGKTYTEHRLIMEAHLGRKLRFNECVHHKNGNGFDNNIKNLKILSRGNHTKHHSKPAKIIKLKCKNCKIKFPYVKSSFEYKRKGQKNFFCTKRCAGIYNQTGNYNKEYRKNILQGIKDNLRICDISRKYNISRCTIENHIKKISHNGSSKDL